MGHDSGPAPGRRWHAFRPRGRTLVGGVVLGLAFVVALLLVGVVGVPGVVSGRPLGAWATRGPATVTGYQPGLNDALLAGVDLPPGYVEAPSLAPGSTAPAADPTPALSPTGAEPSTRAEDRPPERGRRHLECRDLFERPWEVATAGGRPIDRADAEHPTRRGVLRQVLLRLPHSGAAEAALERFRETAAGCQRFTACLGDDCAPVVVRVREVAVSAGDEAYALLVAAQAGQRTYRGYLAVGRVGSVVTVLRHLGRDSRVDADDVATVLRRSLTKVSPLGRERR